MIFMGAGLKELASFLLDLHLVQGLLDAGDGGDEFLERRGFSVDESFLHRAVIGFPEGKEVRGRHDAEGLRGVAAVVDSTYGIEDAAVLHYGPVQVGAFQYATGPAAAVKAEKVVEVTGHPLVAGMVLKEVLVQQKDLFKICADRGHRGDYRLREVYHRRELGGIRYDGTGLTGLPEITAAEFHFHDFLDIRVFRKDAAVGDKKYRRVGVGIVPGLVFYVEQVSDVGVQHACELVADGVVDVFAGEFAYPVSG